MTRRLALVTLALVPTFLVLSSRPAAAWCVTNDTNESANVRVSKDPYHWQEDIPAGQKKCAVTTSEITDLNLDIQQSASGFRCVKTLHSNGNAWLRLAQRPAGIDYRLVYCQVNTPGDTSESFEPSWVHQDTDENGRQVRFLATADPQYWEFNQPYIDLADSAMGMAIGLLGTGDRRGRRGLLVAGDLTDHVTNDEIKMYLDSLGGRSRYVYDGLGNHDLAPEVSCQPVGKCPLGLLENVRDRGRSTSRTNQPANGDPHYSWDWHDVHFVQLNLVPSDRESSDPLRSENPMNALTFLRQDLESRVGGSGRPVVLIHHYGFDSFSTGQQKDASEWWDAGQRKDYWEAIADYNVILIVTGHAHADVGYPTKFDFSRPAAVTVGPDRIFSFIAGAARGSVESAPTGAITDVLIDGDWLYAGRLDDRGMGANTNGDLYPHYLVYFGRPSADIAPVAEPRCLPAGSSNCMFELFGQPVLPEPPDGLPTTAVAESMTHSWTTNCTLAAPLTATNWDTTSDRLRMHLDTLQTCTVSYTAANPYDPRKKTTVVTTIVHAGQQPTVTVPANLTVEATSSTGAIVDAFGASAVDPQDGAIAVSCTPAEGARFPRGETTVSCWATDSDGNAATPGSFKVKVVDTTKPVVTATLSSDPVFEGWHKSPVTVTWTATDAVGVTKRTGCGNSLGQIVISADTDTDGTTLTCVVEDAAANRGSASITIKLDKTGPVITFPTRSPAANEHGWNNTGVSVSFAIADGGSGLEPGTERDGFLLFMTDGKDATQTVDACDRLGNCASVASPKISIDRVAPTIAARRRGPPNANNWYNADVLVDFTCEDAGSAIASCPPVQAVSDEGANRSVTGIARDKAGNQAEVTEAGINLDKTPPVIVGARLTTANQLGWNNTDVIVSFTCSDTLSSVAACGPTPQVISEEGTNLSRSASVTDLAGNTAAASVGGVNIDKTAPAITCAANPSVLWPANGKLVAVGTTVTVDGGLSAGLGFTLVGVTSNEPASPPKQGDTGGDIQGFVAGAPSTSGQLRADRLGSGPGRIYSIVYQGRDGAGNVAACTTTVAVPHSGPVAK